MYASQSELIRKGLEPVVPASHRDNPVAVGGEASYDRRAEAGGCSCDEDLHFNLLTRGFDVCCNGLVVRVPPLLSHWAKNRHGEILANRDARREFEDAWTESQYLSPLLGSAALRRAIYFFEK
jgi:hypothetical protein